MKTELIQARVNEELKEKSAEILKKRGLTMSMAITLFLKELIKQKKLPFKVDF